MHFPDKDFDIIEYHFLDGGINFVKISWIGNLEEYRLKAEQTLREMGFNIYLGDPKPIFNGPCKVFNDEYSCSVNNLDRYVLEVKAADPCLAVDLLKWLEKYEPEPEGHKSKDYLNLIRILDPCPEETWAKIHATFGQKIKNFVKPSNWGPNITVAEDQHGNAVLPRSDEAVKWSLVGLVFKCYKYKNDREIVFVKIKKEVESIMKWNEEERSFTDLLDLVTRLDI